MTVIQYEDIRAVLVEHGSFYFGNWPKTGFPGEPFNLDDSSSTLASFAPTGIGFFSECDDDHDTARVRIRFMSDKPGDPDPGGSVCGEFGIVADELAVATLMMDPGAPIHPPFRGWVGARVHRMSTVVDPAMAERDGEMCEVGEDWVVDVWPA